MIAASKQLYIKNMCSNIYIRFFVDNTLQQWKYILCSSNYRYLLYNMQIFQSFATQNREHIFVEPDILAHVPIYLCDSCVIPIIFF